ncbi:receptor-like protein EIX2 [Silene latifolia]|uniref:receptor-like protein EIX2 n=1 Tax=Silene latifolia TaxID=37657 RepID=UPI003D779D09
MKPFNNLTLIVISWLVLSPCLFYLNLGRNHSNNIQCIDTERDALLHFKHGITNDPCGLLTSWGPHTNCCRWRGVVCSNLTSHVVKLVVYYYDDTSCQLEGKVSPSIGELEDLEHLNLSNNNFSGEIPHQLGNLSKLITLDLYLAYDNVLVHNLSWISRLTLLRYLDLSYVDLSSITNWITIVNSLPSLRVLHMDSCLLPTKTPSLISYTNSSTNLHTISLSRNNFIGSSILRWLFNFPKITNQLVYLDLSGNAFDVPIPSEFENFQFLSSLSLSRNKFKGSVLKLISKLCYLEQLDLSFNNFTDELSNVIDSLNNCNNNGLITLDLRMNGFWGVVPDGIGQFTMLESLYVSSNSLEGTLTHMHFLNLLHLRELDLSDNPKLVVNIYENWIPPFQLDVISLRSCKLGPRFPKWLQSQTNFSYLDVSNTSISDNIPVSFWNSLSSNFACLNMSFNQFYGTLPNLPHISNNAFAIDLSSNLFEGVVPSGFANSILLYLNDNRFSNYSNILCPKTESILRKLDLSNNLFSGELPDCWINFSQLISLHLESNKFFGQIPKSLGTLLSLEFLHLHNNSFSGPLPVTFESLISLRILNLGYNLFSGNIPPWIGNSFQSLGAFILRKNHFVGEIPGSICQLGNLQILDLAINNLSGVIPNCISNFTTMERKKNPSMEFSSYDIITLDVDDDVGTGGETTIVSWKREEERFKDTFRFVKYIDLSALELLDLSNNHLTGEIPISLAKVTYLGTLDVSNNNLSGQIPVSTQLQSFDASQYAGNPRLCGNELRGEIPYGILILNGLESLDLSKNKLSGNIPFEIGNLTALELLDMSNNHLTGEIPTSLAKVTTLKIMNVSNNNLYGKIPVSTQL